jgi:hypothetical protein
MLKRVSDMWAAWLGVVVIAASGGCASTHPDPPERRRAFDFQHDTFAYANELVWIYYSDEHGKWVSHPRVPKPEYSHHCFVVARSARQFFDHARFDPDQPKADAETYRRLVHEVLSLSPRRELPDSRRIAIPGYADLRSFSEAYEAMLKEECGGAWQSYFQRGHWRIIAPFTRHQQEQMAKRLLTEIRENHPPVAHLVRFPHLTINHAIVLFGAAETSEGINFTAYDPNDPAKPVTLSFDAATRTFQLPANDYFCGGRVDVYEVYYNWCY